MLRSRGKTSVTTRRWTTSPIATESSRARASRFAPSRTGSARPRTSTRRRRCWRPSPRMTVRSPTCRTSSATPSRRTRISACSPPSRRRAPAPTSWAAGRAFRRRAPAGRPGRASSPARARLGALVGAVRERGLDMRSVDVGGVMGISYRDETPPAHAELARVVVAPLRPLGVTVLLEPGRSVVGNAGALLTRVLYRKETPDKRFVVVDAAMNDLIRPAFYDAFHEIRPVSEARRSAPVERADVVGPICESGDFLAKDRDLARPEEGDVLAVMSAGAYGFAMASNYNTRPRAAEVL